MPNSRRKGHDFERKVARALRDVYPDARRGLQYRDARECDVEGTPWRIECKRSERLNIMAAYRQAVEDGRGDPRPVAVISKVSNTPAVVTVSLADFKRMLLIPKE